MQLIVVTGVLQPTETLTDSPAGKQTPVASPQQIPAREAHAHSSPELTGTHHTFADLNFRVKFTNPGHMYAGQHVPMYVDTNELYTNLPPCPNTH